MKELANFHDELIDIYGYMVQVGAAIGQWHKILATQVNSRRTRPTNTMFFGSDDPSAPGAKYQYRRTFAELIEASAQKGITSNVHRRSVVVLVVASWEDRYRKRIAEECGVRKNTLTSDLFHDLNRYRQAILHAGGKLREEPKALRLFEKGDEVTLTNDQMDTIFREIIDELNRIGTELYGKNPRFSFDKQLGN